MTDEATPIRDLLPEKGWLADYVKYCAATMMAPVEYILACGLAALSAAVGRGVWFRLGGGSKRWHPHLWVVLFGPAGWQKSTPTHAVSKLIIEARGQDAILPKRFSKEAFYDALKEMPDGFWDIGELSAFIKGSHSENMSGIRDELSDLWDSPEMWKRKLRKEIIPIERPAPTAIATARPDLFEEAAGLADFSSGFLSRFLLFEPPQEAEPPYVGIDLAEGVSDESAEGRWRWLVDDLKEIAVLHGGEHRASFDADAKALHRRCDQEWLKEAREGVAAELSGWAMRRGIQAQKLSVLHALSRSGKPDVEGEDMAWGVALSGACWQISSNIALEKVGLDREGSKRARVWDNAAALMRKQGGVASRREIMKRVWRNVRDKRELSAVLETWEEAGNVELGTIRIGRGPIAAAVRILNGKPAPEGWVPNEQADA